MAPPLSVNVKRVVSGYTSVIGTPAPITVTFADPVHASLPGEQLPRAGELLILITGGGPAAQPVWTGKGAWSELFDLTDPNGRYCGFSKVSDGTETSLTFTSFVGNYLRIAVAAARVRGGIHEITEYDGPDATTYPTPDLSTTRITGRMDMVTGNVAPSGVPAPADTTDWFEVGRMGNVALGSSTQGWWARYSDGEGEDWVNPQLCRASASWLIDLPTGGPTINMIGSV